MIADRRDLRRVEHAVATILAETDRPLEVYARTLETVARELGWDFGAVWECHPEDGKLRCVRTWVAGELEQEFVALSERYVFSPGEGLPGRVLESGEPAWITDPPEDGNFPRAAAARRAQLRAAFSIPLKSPR